MLYNRAVNIMSVAYHYFTIKPGLFEARVFVYEKFFRAFQPLSRISAEEKGCRTNLLVRQPRKCLVKFLRVMTLENR